MALQVNLNNGEKLQTSVGIPLTSVYVQISHLEYDKDAFDADLQVRYFVSKAAADIKQPVKEMKNGVERTVNRASAGFSVAGLPNQVTVGDPLGLLASPNANAYTIAYQLLHAALEAALPITVVEAA